MAELDAQIPTAERKEAEALRCLLFARLLEAERQIQAVEDAIRTAQQQRESLRKEQEEIKALLEECARLRELLRAIENDLTLRADAWQAAINRHGEIQKRVKDLEELKAGLPARWEALAAIDALAERLMALIALEAELAAAVKELEEIREILAAIRNARGRLHQAGKQVQACQAAAERAAWVLSEVRIRAALLEWAEMEERLAECEAVRKRLEEVAAQLEEAKKRIEEAAGRAARAAGRFYRGLAAVAAGILTAAGAFLAGLAAPAAAIGLVLLLLGTTVAVRAKAEAEGARADERKAHSEHDSLAGVRQELEERLGRVAAQVRQWTIRKENAREALEQLNEPLPASAGEARERAEQLPDVPLAQAGQAWQEAQVALSKAHAEHEAARDALARETERLGGRKQAPLRETIRSLKDQIQRESGVRAELAKRGLPIDPQELDTERALIRQKLEANERAVAELDDLRAQLKSASEAIETARGNLEARWKEVIDAKPLPETPELARSKLVQIAKEARAKLRDLDEEKLKREDERLHKELRRVDGEILLLQRELDERRKEAHGLREKLGAGEGVPSEAIRARFPELAEAHHRTVTEWERELECRKQETHGLRVRRAELALSLGLDDTPLDLAAEGQAVAAEERRQAVKRRAGEIVAKARRTILDRVMPLTEQHVARILPLLTEGRYRDVKWNDDSGTLTVFDAQARRHVRKGVFSGGARDQISLALRLAFALATLPGEHAIRPGWLILDEPLSSFDRVRTQALVDLVTGQGLIKRQFPQVFLISHSESVDPERFDHRLRLESGRITASTLPASHAVVVNLQPSLGEEVPP